MGVKGGCLGYSGRKGGKMLTKSELIHDMAMNRTKLA